MPSIYATTALLKCLIAVDQLYLITPNVVMVCLLVCTVFKVKFSISFTGQALRLDYHGAMGRGGALSLSVPLPSFGSMQVYHQPPKLRLFSLSLLISTVLAIQVHHQPPCFKVFSLSLIGTVLVKGGEVDCQTATQRHAPVTCKATAATVAMLTSCVTRGNFYLSENLNIVLGN